jgi:hypothetical protein
MYILFLLIAFLFTSCSSSDEEAEVLRKLNQKGEFIYRKHNEHLFNPPLAERVTPEAYPWEKGFTGTFPKITKEFFRCKGSHLNPVRIVQQKEEIARFYDCGGSEKHSLPLRDNKEFIHPILIDLLNYIQAKTNKRVVITSGHRCPEHNTYVDPSPENQFSKHMVGAEVSFYVQGLEERPESIVKLIQDYYQKTAKYKDKKDFQEFSRYEKGDTNVSTLPWMNKEIFIKLFTKKEGRNFDNRHPYPYLSIQVRWDDIKKEKVIYTWDQANHNYLRR